MATPKFDPRTMYLLWRAGEAVRNLAEKRRSTASLSFAKYVALSYLRDHDDLTAADIARKIGISPQSTNESISAMERDGLLQKIRGATNRKSRYLVLTATGLAALTETENSIDEIEDSALDGLSADDIANLRKYLSIIIASSKRA